jgi:UDP-N-acetyl-D-mannosaminuronic acid dehydrogenase
MMKISPKTTHIAVCGLGYVGFPVALLFAKAGFQVTGVDVNEEKIRKINRGGNPIEGKEPGLKELIGQVKKTGRFQATTDPASYQEAQVIIIAVETPVEEETHEPAYRALKSALRDIGQNLSAGRSKEVLIIVESTIAPQTMAKVVQPILEAESGLQMGPDFLLANCPERLMPGHLIENITNYNRVIGAPDQRTADLAKSLYKYIVKGKLETTDWVTAEIVKAGENAYRDVQIAFANEMALLCEALGANVWEVRRLINECKRRGETRFEALRQMHFPGAGVGGHCLPKDSWLLVYGARESIEPKLIPLARRINNFMPRHMVELLKDGLRQIHKPLAQSKIAVLGYAYAGNSDDSRNTPTEELLKILRHQGAKPIVHDPYIKEYKIPLGRVLKGAQAIVLMANHDQYQTDKNLNYHQLKRLMKPHPIIIDGRNVFDKEKAQKAGFIYKGVGNI